MVDSTPSVPSANKISPAMSAIKIATPDIILVNNESIPQEIMVDLTFEDIGGQEIISIARNDLVNGQKIVYQPIKNLIDINFQYNSKNIISLENTSQNYFDNFPIKLDSKVPAVGTGPNGEFVYMDETTGDLVVNVVNLVEDEQVEIQILTTGSLLDDTIYEG
jgi:hypothetical protein